MLLLASKEYYFESVDLFTVVLYNVYLEMSKTQDVQSEILRGARSGSGLMVGRQDER